MPIALLHAMRLAIVETGKKPLTMTSGDSCLYTSISPCSKALATCRSPIRSPNAV
ncbi:MAG: hypothetical protein GXW98_03565 [Bifidobacterium crudilactis]|uniref:Uncharacterized protein n=1 Tax=Bifidobacterium crudilactis TaxID=327277 RepID=A0A971CYC5_9BIFI|nr:hypothetical protein [Bifidobacterium crudilactis]